MRGYMPVIRRVLIVGVVVVFLRVAMGVRGVVIVATGGRQVRNKRCRREERLLNAAGESVAPINSNHSTGMSRISIKGVKEACS